MAEQPQSTRSDDKTGRLGFGLAATLFGLACVVLTFTPEGRETISWIVSAALFVFSAGTVSYTMIRLKNK
jgi:hypothetical protein